MNDFVILHLSDLHIDSNNGDYSRVLQKLIDDIKIQSEQLFVKDKTMVVCVTGDILHKGSSASYDAALKFFKDLKKSIGKKINKIYMVPGNHDHIRLPKNNFLISSYRTLQNNQLSYKNLLESQNVCKDFDDVFYNDIWDNHLDGYRKKSGSGYLELHKEVHKLFKMPKREYLKNTFGVDVVTVNGVNYCFVLLNTSWSCTDDNDTRNIFLGQFQLNIIKKQFHKCLKSIGCSEESIKRDELITIVMGHHPVGALNALEEDTLFSDMVSFEEFDANVYLCGHTHERSIINWSNNRHSIDTYVTGLGWPEESTIESVQRHTYSMYVFNTDLNSIDIKVRSTDDRGEFDIDTRFNSGSKIRPINSTKTQSYIKLSTIDEKNQKHLYWSEEFHNFTKSYLKWMAIFSYKIEKYIENDKATLLLNFNETERDIFDKQTLQSYLFGDPKLGEYELVKSILSGFNEMIYHRFYGFLQSVCMNLIDFFISDLLKEGGVARVHFRYFDSRDKEFNYKRLCQELCGGSGNGGVSDELKYSLSTFNYTDLIKASFENNESLIYSINEHNCNIKLNDKWKNFITMVPKFHGNITYIENDGFDNMEYPLLTFGITCNNDDINKLFYCMDIFDFKIVLETYIKRYVDIFQINLEDFCEYARKG